MLTPLKVGPIGWIEAPPEREPKPVRRLSTAAWGLVLSGWLFAACSASAIAWHSTAGDQPPSAPPLSLEGSHQIATLAAEARTDTDRLALLKLLQQSLVSVATLRKVEAEAAGDLAAEAARHIESIRSALSRSALEAEQLPRRNR